MRNIIPNILSLAIYLMTLKSNPDLFRPSCCIHCGLAGLRSHGYYYRKCDRDSAGCKTLNPIPIRRFYCPQCRHTSSVLPECISPRRWYLWAVQHVCLISLLESPGYREVSRTQTPSRRTLSRWLHHLMDRSCEFSSHLKSKFSWLGYHSHNFLSFWRACLQKMSLSQLMLTLNQRGVTVP